MIRAAACVLDSSHDLQRTIEMCATRGIEIVVAAHREPGDDQRAVYNGLRDVVDKQHVDLIVVAGPWRGIGVSVHQRLKLGVAIVSEREVRASPTRTAIMSLVSERRDEIVRFYNQRRMRTTGVRGHGSRWR